MTSRLRRCQRMSMATGSTDASALSSSRPEIAGSTGSGGACQSEVPQYRDLEKWCFIDGEKSLVINLGISRTVKRLGKATGGHVLYEGQNGEGRTPEHLGRSAVALHAAIDRRTTYTSPPRA